MFDVKSVSFLLWQFCSFFAETLAGKMSRTTLNILLRKLIQPCWIRRVSPGRRQALFSVAICLLGVSACCFPAKDVGFYRHKTEKLDCLHSSNIYFIRTVCSSMPWCWYEDDERTPIRVELPRKGQRAKKVKSSRSAVRGFIPELFLRCSWQGVQWGALSLTRFAVPGRSVTGCGRSWSRTTASWPRRSTRRSWAAACARPRSCCRNCTLTTPSWR